MGYQRLGSLLLSEARKASVTSLPSSYCLKYAVLHLCLAGPSCSDLLDAALSCWDFIRAAIKSRHGRRQQDYGRPGFNVSGAPQPFCR